jgi:amiloride-sensitive sodium channel
MEGDKFFGLERSEPFGIVDFIGNCGGLLGLFMGVSVLSIIS